MTITSSKLFSSFILILKQPIKEEMPFCPPPQFFGVGRGEGSSDRVKDIKAVRFEKGAKIANPASKF